MSEQLVDPAGVEWFGDRAVLVRCGSTDRAAAQSALAAALPARRVRAGLTTVLVEAGAPDPGLRDEVRAACRSAVPSPSSPDARHVTISADYVGPDLATVARALDCDTGALVRAHCAQVWRVALLGFAPGFAYLEPADTATIDWARVPRRDSPRARVDAGSVAIAAGMSAVYPRAMPGGWAVIGRADVELFRPADAAHPSLLRAGDLVRFEARR